MTETKTITLAGDAIEVPALPIRINMKAYPLCRKLTNADYPNRYVASAVAGGGLVEVTDEELADLVEIAFCGAQAANPELTREEFDNWPITPPELLDAFFPIRLQTGAWVAGKVAEEGGDEPGEAKGSKKRPRK